MRSLIVISLSCFALAACDFGSEGAFTSGADLLTCDGSVPVCNTTAGCKMIEEDHYIEGEFPGFRQFIVETAGEAYIRIKIYWRTQLSPGSDTEIRWFEPACVENYRYESQGLNIFDEADGAGIWYKDERVFRAGDHLIEIRSDATGEYILRPEVLTVSEWEAQQAPELGEGGSPITIPF